MHFDLDKESQKVKFMLSKHDLPKITAEVVVLSDVSGSAKELYVRGTMQEAIQRVLPIAIQFDDNGEVPVYVFNGGVSYFQLDDDLTSRNYSTYVTRQILQNSAIDKWGTTSYEPVTTQALIDLGFCKQDPAPQTQRSLLNRISGGLLGVSPPPPSSIFHMRQKSDSGMPALIYTLTDGVPDDETDIQDLLRECVAANTEAYFNYLGVGAANFKFLRQIADDFPNVGFAAIRDIEKVAGTDEIYEFLLPTEMINWLRVSGK